MENLKKFCKEKSITFFFPIAFILTIVPLIVRLKLLDNNSETLAVFGGKSQTDLFSQNKALFLMIFSAILVIIAIIGFKSIFKKKDKLILSITILSIIFLVLTFLSSIFSQYKNIAFWGIYDRAEGFITIGCYIILFIYSMYAFKSTKDFKCILIPIMIVVLINGFLGLFQYFGQDLLKTEFGGLIANVNPKNLDLSYESGKIYGTLYHYNYVGSFAAIVIPILIGSLFFEDDVFLKIMILGSIGCSIWLLLGSTSRAGLIGMGASLVFMLIVFGKILLKSWKPLVISLGCIVAIAVILNFATGNKLFQRIPSLISDATSIFKNTSDFNYKEYTAIKDVQHIDGHIEVTVPNNVLKIYYEDNQYVFRNLNNDIIDYVKNVDSKTKTKTYSTTDSQFSNISFRFGPYLTKNKDDGLLLYLNNSPAFMFNLKDDGTIHLINGNSKQDIEIEFPDTFGFNGKEKLASSRGYIWSRSIPMLKDTLLIGKGPDTFVFDFPQNDLIGKLYAYDSATEIVDKPHNLYLQIGISEGVVALIAFLAIVLLYIIDSLKLYALKKSFNESEIMGSAVFLGIIGYLSAGIFNDSIISVAPIFWTLFGVGFAINYINKKSLTSK